MFTNLVSFFVNKYKGNELFLTGFRYFLFSIVLILNVVGSYGTTLNHVEEGWRYRASLNLKISRGLKVELFDDNFLPTLHSNMAFVINGAYDAYKNSGLPDSKGRMFSLFRFTPVIRQSSRLTLGSTVSLTNLITQEVPDHALAPGIASYELVFVSGFFDLDNNKKGPLAKLIKDRLIKGYDGVYDGAQFRNKPNLFVLTSPPPTAVLPYRFLMRNYIDPEILARNVNHRYFPEDPSSTILNCAILQKIHSKVRTKLDERMKVAITTMDECKKKLLHMDIVEALRELEQLKMQRREFHNVFEANSYTCAEQLGLDFIRHERTGHHLRKNMCIEDEAVQAIMIHLHTTETPCGTCATSLARECETGGLLRELFNNKPILLICTCSEHYKRPEGRIPYNKTFFMVEGELKKQDIEFDLVKRDCLPYSVILYKEQLQPSPHYEIDTKEYDLIKGNLDIDASSEAVS